jgi:ketosteroid isomerase-like protein
MKSRTAALFLAIAVLLLGCNRASSEKNAAARQMIKAYYTAYEKKDWSLMAPILADSFTFTSPAGDDHIDLKTYKERCWPNSQKTKSFDLEKVMVDGDDALVTYNGRTTSGSIFRNTERFKFKDGKIVENECFFGTGVSFPNNEGK